MGMPGQSRPLRNSIVRLLSSPVICPTPQLGAAQAPQLGAKVLHVDRQALLGVHSRMPGDPSSAVPDPAALGDVVQEVSGPRSRQQPASS